MNKRVPVIDDDAEASSCMRRILEMGGYEVQEENDSTHALPAAEIFQPHIVILDYVMPKMHGGDVAWQLARATKLNLQKLIICSGKTEVEMSDTLSPIHMS